MESDLDSPAAAIETALRLTRGGVRRDEAEKLAHGALMSLGPSRTTDDLHLRRIALEIIGVTERDRSNVDLAIRYLSRARQLAKSEGDPAGAASLSVARVTACLNSGQVERAEAYLRRAAVDTYQAGAPAHVLAEFWGRELAILEAKGEYEACLLMIEAKLLPLSFRAESAAMQASRFNALARAAVRRQAHPALIDRYLGRSAALLKDEWNPIMEVVRSAAIGELLVLERDYRHAEACLVAAESLLAIHAFTNHHVDRLRQLIARQ